MSAYHFSELDSPEPCIKCLQPSKPFKREGDSSRKRQAVNVIRIDPTVRITRNTTPPDITRAYVAH